MNTLEDFKKIFENDKKSNFHSKSAEKYAKMKENPEIYKIFRAKMRSYPSKNKTRKEMDDDRLMKVREYARIYYAKRKLDPEYRKNYNQRALKSYYKNRKFINIDCTFGIDRNPINWINKHTMELYNVKRFEML